MLLTQEGYHGWLGRHVDPTAEELERAATSIRERGTAGWLCVTEGVYYDPEHTLKVMLVRPLAGQGDWETALAAFHAQRAEALKVG